MAKKKTELEQALSDFRRKNDSRTEQSNRIVNNRVRD